jgi:hypothetical protein
MNQEQSLNCMFDRTAGSLLGETSASGQTVLTNTAPDGGVRLETYY